MIIHDNFNNLNINNHFTSLKHFKLSNFKNVYLFSEKGLESLPKASKNLRIFSFE